MPSRSSSTTTSAKPEPPSGAATTAHLQGVGASAGIVVGSALVIGRDVPAVAEIELRPEDIPAEIERFERSLAVSRRQLEALRREVAAAIGEDDAQIFDAHLILVGDKSLVKEVRAGIGARRRNAEFVFKQVIDRYAEALRDVDDTYIRDRRVDVQDVAFRVIRNLAGATPTDLTSLPEPRIIVAHDLSPSDTGGMDRQNVIGFVTCIGSRTAHTAIMARSMGIPSVVGLADATAQVSTGDLLIVDGTRGTVTVRPTEPELAECRRRIRAQARWFRRIVAEAELPAETMDGFRVQLAANVELPEELETIKRTYGVGIGLFRTEFLFVKQPAIPDEEQQFETYRKIAEEIAPQSVIFRTLDIGGDKFMSHLPTPNELNPFLGMRAIRFSLSRPDIFMAQLRAILRASAYGKVRIMFPLVATLEELDRALTHLRAAQAELDAAGIPYNRHLDVGTMIEVPAAALLADRLAERVDFFSVGTNDLIQYSLAVDRANPDIAHLYQPSHPSIIRMLAGVIRAASPHGRWVSVCGEMASDPLLVPLILGLGIHELSMSPVALGPVKRLVRHICMYDAENLVRRAVACATGSEVLALCEEFVQRVAPDILRQ